MVSTRASSADCPSRMPEATPSTSKGSWAIHWWAWKMAALSEPRVWRVASSRAFSSSRARSRAREKRSSSPAGSDAAPPPPVFWKGTDRTRQMRPSASPGERGMPLRITSARFGVFMLSHHLALLVGVFPSLPASSLAFQFTPCVCRSKAIDS